VQLQNEMARLINLINGQPLGRRNHRSLILPETVNWRLWPMIHMSSQRV